mmetsp:Transcript_63114/g.150789  ORF Transcript_63114/g.150789 Transcript_63114/m.150789 type:complete len:235 (-) Transcript_63114:1193-1897(-)
MDRPFGAQAQLLAALADHRASQSQGCRQGPHAFEGEACLPQGVSRKPLRGRCLLARRVGTFLAGSAAAPGEAGLQQALRQWPERHGPRPQECRGGDGARLHSRGLVQGCVYAGERADGGGRQRQDGPGSPGRRADSSGLHAEAAHGFFRALARLLDILGQHFCAKARVLRGGTRDAGPNAAAGGPKLAERPGAGGREEVGHGLAGHGLDGRGPGPQSSAWAAPLSPAGSQWGTA